VKTRLAFIVGAGVGYVLGTRAGRERFEELAGRVEVIWLHPRVQRGVRGAQAAAQEAAGRHLPHLAARVVRAAREAVGLELPR